MGEKLPRLANVLLMRLCYNAAEISRPGGTAWSQEDLNEVQPWKKIT